MSRLEQRIEVMERGAGIILAELAELRRELAAEAELIPAAVVAAVCGVMKVSVERVLSAEKQARMVAARHACALALHRRGYSYPRIARILKMGCHSSAVYAVQHAKELEQQSESVRDAVAAGEAVGGPKTAPRTAAHAPAPPGLRHGRAPLHWSCSCERCLRSRPQPRVQAEPGVRDQAARILSAEAVR
jgi:hypothetical protein